MINLIPESSSAPPAARKRYNTRSVLLSLVFVVCFPLSGILAGTGGSLWIAYAVFAASILSVLALSYEFVCLMRSLDELQQRIHITALAIGFGFAGVAITLWGMASLVTDAAMFTADEAVFVLPAALIGYYAALHFFLRQYR